MKRYVVSAVCVAAALLLSGSCVPSGTVPPGSMNITLELADTLRLAPDSIAKLVQADARVIEARVKRFSPLFWSVKDKDLRIVVQLPGIANRVRAESLICKPGLLEFTLLADDKRTEQVINKVDSLLRPRQRQDPVGSFRTYIASAGGDLAVDEQYYPIVRDMLGMVDAAHIAVDYKFFFGPKEREAGGIVRKLYLLRRVPEMSTADGKMIDKAVSRRYTGTDDPSASNTFIVDFTLSRTSNVNYNPVVKFATVTQRNVNKRLAIVLDSVVLSAPVIKSKIPDGQGMITTGDVDGEKARDLAVILSTEVLPARVTVTQVNAGK